jgi:5-methylcytosine-specific restriction endonuclease McrA
MSGHVLLGLKKQVRERAGDVCEYCRLPQAAQEATFHIDHIQPRAAEGRTTLENLALACVTCSLKKSAKTHAIDVKTRKSVPLFHPRRDDWWNHFRWGTNCLLIGKTAIGRATVRALGMNRPAIVIIRRSLVALGKHEFAKR